MRNDDFQQSLSYEINQFDLLCLNEVNIIPEICISRPAIICTECGQ